MKATPWKAPANATDEFPDAWERRCGHFVLCAWPDGFWAIDFRFGPDRHRIRDCREDEIRNERCDSLDSAQACCEGVFRNFLAEAVGDFGEAP
jgi:hypothetical protein